MMIENAVPYVGMVIVQLAQFFLLGFLGFLLQIFGYTGLMYSSASLSTTILNLIPGFTFVFAVIFRMEKFNYRSSTTLAISFGTMVSIIGALIVTLYQGPSIWQISPNSNATTLQNLTSSSAWLVGGLLLTIDSIVSSIFIIAQALVLKKCPFELILMLFYSCFVAILSAAVALMVEKDFSAWSLKSTTTLIPIIYSALFGNVFQVSIIMWCVRKRGPLFASVFHPLGVIFATAMGVIILGEALYLGSLLGALVVVVGFYAVVWGKAKEAKKIEENGVKSLESNGKRVPLLLNNTDDGDIVEGGRKGTGNSLRN
ncbi:hypothetical protein ACS0TY_010196 [Phlomoides rotata]